MVVFFIRKYAPIHGEKKYIMKEGFVIQQITKHQKEYGIKSGIIRKVVHKTKNGKCYVDDFIAMKIWIALGVEPEKVLKVKQEFEERNRMANEPF